MFKWQFEATLHYLDVGMVLAFASEGLLSEEEDFFTECYELLSELFQKYSSEVCKKRNEAYFTLTNLFRVYAPEIVKSCCEVILSSRKILFVKKCGRMLRVLNNAGKTLIPGNLEITEQLICKAWKESSEKISSDQSLLEDFKKLINAPRETESGNVAALINSRFYSTSYK
ncbi:hypothetical protein RF11_09031 [Thelohanellus kitauei]|uniref:Uncharacterized protein n=1 Tax=Thelohanellus kitauei TaxID=669202 RepID=A0A0C2N9X1_THEKT|nr:hypothetical protein RF11_09031 [Thelohanellus kitauei]